MRASILLVLALLSHCMNAQTASDNQVKAAYLYNFTRFVEWPQISAGREGPIRLCVLDYPPLVAELKQVVQGKSTSGRPLTVLLTKTAEESRDCHVLFIGSAQEKQVRHILYQLRDKNVLTVGETDDFLNEGGMISFVIQDEHVQFTVNNRAATEAGLRISARLLTVAKRVIQ